MGNLFFFGNHRIRGQLEALRISMRDVDNDGEVVLAKKWQGCI